MSQFNRQVNKLLDLLYTSAYSYKEWSVHMSNPKLITTFTNLSTRRKLLAREIEQTLSQESIPVCKIIENTPRHAFFNKREGEETIHHFSIMDSTIAKQYTIVSRNNSCSKDLRVLIHEHQSNLLADQKELNSQVFQKI